MRIVFDIEMPRTRVGLLTTGNGKLPLLRPLLFALVEVNLWHLNHGNFPPLYSSGVVYQPEPPGEEDWKDLVGCLRDGWGDCEDLACWRVAEYRKRGIHAVPEMYDRQIDCIRLIHVLCRLPDGRLEDPSKQLGMRGRFQ
jgi:hypothetical protein